MLAALKISTGSVPSHSHQAQEKTHQTVCMAL
uniref:Uncharacterized protein n=1 Tax=Arundo donax TaxID=35708 RepID=A0A0A9H1C9_ARUDO